MIEFEKQMDNVYNIRISKK